MKAANKEMEILKNRKANLRFLDSIPVGSVVRFKLDSKLSWSKEPVCFRRNESMIYLGYEMDGVLACIHVLYKQQRHIMLLSVEKPSRCQEALEVL